MLKRAKYYHRKLDVNAHPKRMAAWFPSVRKWPEDYLSEERPLRVYFMNECPQSWQCTVNPEVIMKFLKGSWTKCFTIGDNPEDSPIRVLFEGTNIMLIYSMGG
jgi:hypothetical protein